jgi:acetyl esterase
VEPHPYYQAIIDLYRESNRPFYHQISVEAGRAMLQAATAAAPAPSDLPELTKVWNHEIAGPHGAIPLRVYEPKAAQGGTVVYFHSGGWVIGDINTADATCRRLAGAARCRVVSVNYRLAPEHPFPQPLDDAFASLEWAANEWPERLVVAGESSGGNLAAACAIRSREAGGPALVGQWLAYPVVDHDFSTGSYQDIGPRNWLLSTADMQWFWNHYCPAGIDRTNPEVSPLRVGTVQGLPPAMVVLGELDPLRDEGLAYVARLASAGVSVASRCDAGMVHGYIGGAGAIPAAAEALRTSGDWIRARLDS